ncbi:MAG: aminotransferase class III-fold pyridoxal phosphate-dependent enzyme [Chloroflexi bacterium]|nr:aminotransferase class III-fold pyridoxal phosphate-dependent enzyme [Chloroflexota bacterium]
MQARYDHGMLQDSSGTIVIRFDPPLIMQKAHVDELIDKLTQILETIDDAE